MKAMRILPVPSLFVALLLAGPAATAWADEAACSTDLDCAPEEYCEMYRCDGSDCDPTIEQGWCRSMDEFPMPWEEDYGCESDADCGASEYCLGMIGECVPTWFTACESEADCGEGLRCIDFAGFDDDGGWDDDDAIPPMPIPMPEMPKSDEESTFFCAPEWLRPEPCDTDADCSDGFSCVDVEICSCSGGGAEPGWDGPPFEGDEDGGFKEDDDCFCEPSGESWCELDEVECDSASDCPSGWTCESFSDGDTVCWSGPDGDEGCEEPDEDVSYCVPPYFTDVIGGVPGSGFQEDTATGGGTPRDDVDSPEPFDPDSDAGATPPDGEADGSTGGSTGGGSARPESGSSGGCSAAPASAPTGGALLLGLFGALGFVRRRR
jgi:MYXO-CTERM domain-containing protein